MGELGGARTQAPGGSTPEQVASREITTVRAGPPPLPARRPPPLPATRPAPAPGDVPKGTLERFEVIGGYQVLKRLAAGGMADVYLARALRGGRDETAVALKTALPRYGPGTPSGSLFLSEARISATLQHPGLVQVFDYGEAEGRPYLAMEYVPGRDLSLVLQRLRELGRPAPPEVAVAVAIEVARALEYVHAKRTPDGRHIHLVHRDVSPGNVVLTRTGAKLIDFGVASADDAPESRRLFVGKLAYLTGPQARGEPPSPDWDLYALGVVLYELLTLRRPYRVASAEDLFLGRIVDRRIGPSEVSPRVPPELDVLAFVATEQDPAVRFRTAAELRASLEAVAARLPPPDLGAFLEALFGDALQTEQTELEALQAEGRLRETHRRVGLASRWMRRLRARSGSHLQPRMVRLAAAGAALLLGAAAALSRRGT